MSRLNIQTAGGVASLAALASLQFEGVSAGITGVLLVVAGALGLVAFGRGVTAEQPDAAWMRALGSNGAVYLSAVLLAMSPVPFAGIPKVGMLAAVLASIGCGLALLATAIRGVSATNAVMGTGLLSHVPLLAVIGCAALVSLRWTLGLSGIYATASAVGASLVIMSTVFREQRK